MTSMGFISALSFQCLIIGGKCNHCFGHCANLKQVFTTATAINNSLTGKLDVVSHQARSVVVPSLVDAGLVRGSGCLRAGRTTGRTAAQEPVG